MEMKLGSGYWFGRQGSLRGEDGQRIGYGRNLEEREQCNREGL